MSDVPERKMSPEWRGRAWVDLFTAELNARSAQHHVTGRALLYLEAGLPMEQVLDALKITRIEWDDRVEACGRWRAENRATAERLWPKDES